MPVLFNQRYDGEWVDVTDERAFACCDCGLVHNYEHIVITSDGNLRILRRAWRDRRATANRRRIKAIKAGIKALAKRIRL